MSNEDRIEKTESDLDTLSKVDIAIYKGWLRNKSSKEIANSIKKDEEYVNHVINRLNKTSKTFENSVKLLEKMHVINPVQVPQKLAPATAGSTYSSIGTLKEKAQITIGTLKENDWQLLVRLIKKRKCVPFVGERANIGTLPQVREIAYRWAKLYDYPLRDSHDLAQVSQFLAINKNDIFPKRLLSEEFQDVKPPNFFESDEPHGVLADLDLPIYITTNYDSFMIKALRSRGKAPMRDFCRWNKASEVLGMKSILDSDSSYTPTPDRPLVYHLRGYYEIPESMVLTEADHIDWLIRLQDENQLLPPEIISALASNHLLFVGYSLADWEFRVLLRGFLRSFSNLGFFMIAVVSPPYDLEGRVENMKVLDYVYKYYENFFGMKVRMYWGDPRQFARNLRELAGLEDGNQ